MYFPLHAFRYLAIIMAAAIASAADVQPEDRSVKALAAPERHPAAAAHQRQAVAMTGHLEGVKMVQIRRGGKPGVLQVDNEQQQQQQQQHGRMAKAKKSGKGTREEQNNFGNKCDIEDFISDTTYEHGGTCDKMFKVKIDCNDDRDLCTFEEESIHGTSESKSAHDTCVPFDPEKWLRYDSRRDQCVLGNEKGLRLKDQSDMQGCSAKYNVKVVMEMDDTSTLYLYFSDNDGESFYNLDDPRVATKDLADRDRRMLQSSCIYYGDLGAQIKSLKSQFDNLEATIKALKESASHFDNLEATIKALNESAAQQSQKMEAKMRSCNSLRGWFGDTCGDDFSNHFSPSRDNWITCQDGMKCVNEHCRTSSICR